MRFVAAGRRQSGRPDNRIGDRDGVVRFDAQPLGRGLGGQTAHEIAHALAILGEAAFELGQLGVAVRSDAALIRRGHVVGLGPPLALMAGGHTRHLQRCRCGPAVLGALLAWGNEDVVGVCAPLRTAAAETARKGKNSIHQKRRFLTNECTGDDLGCACIDMKTIPRSSGDGKRHLRSSALDPRSS